MDDQWVKTQLKLHPEKTKADLARFIGLEPPAVSKILNGSRQIKAHEYIKMRSFFGMVNDGNKAVSRAHDYKSSSQDSYVIEPLANNEMHDSTAPLSNNNWIMPASIVGRHTKTPPEKIKLFAVEGNAMDPDFASGEQVLVDTSDTKPSPSGFFVLSDGMGHIIRQCEYIPHSTPALIKISARNSQYESYEIELKKTELIGRVIAKLQWL